MCIFLSLTYCRYLSNYKASAKSISLIFELQGDSRPADQWLMKGSQTSTDSAVLITRNTAYIAKSRKSLLIPLLDLVKGTRLLDGLLLPALLRGQPKVVTVPAAMAQLLSSLCFPVWEKRKHGLRNSRSNPLQTRGLGGRKKMQWWK